MRFGAIALAEAERAILAHTLRLPGGVLKKGRVLSRDDLDALARAGYQRVTAARLDPDDVAENQAAAEIALVVAGDNIRVAEAFTGRCNLYACDGGIALIDGPRIDALNRIDEAVTVATVAPFAEVGKGDMVATVKVIPFAVPRRVIAACAATVAESGAISARVLAPHRAALVLTRLPGIKDAVLDRAARNTRSRLARLGSELALETRCDHEINAVARAVGDALAAGCAPVLIFGASAIVDRRDVIPAGIEKAGGSIDHFGMPVDPGNLLLLAHVGETAIIGAPGCARSLKPSGFDWVLARALVGVHVGSGEIMAMGVGGLLADIPARPQPRQPSAARAETGGSPGQPRVAAVVLAAGQSRRMGAQNKLVAEVAGKPMVARVVTALMASPVAPIVVVTGHEPARVEAALAPLAEAGSSAFSVVHNPGYKEGMSTSVAAGIAAIEGRADAALVCLGDMPWVGPSHVQALIDRFNPIEGRAICVPVYDGKPGNPVLFGADFFSAMKTIRGDTGARQIVREHPELVHHVTMPDSAVLLDLDTADALASLQSIDDPAGLPPLSDVPIADVRE